MAVYLITYDLMSPRQDYKDLYVAIESFPTRLHPFQSVWFVKSEKGAKEIYNHLNQHLDNDDKLLVVEMQKHWWGRFGEQNQNWLKTNL
ncbi:hypothetical protein V7127_02490 [Bacillus sp. JJ1773]|uniref:hypothetical protein n=1 Tax=Bacillus sp. JJ1773 TaxID=3122965 RepID=UPI0030009235